MKRLLSLLEDHFARTHEWWALEIVMFVKLQLGVPLNTGGWVK